MFDKILQGLLNSIYDLIIDTLQHSSILKPIKKLNEKLTFLKIILSN